VELTNDNFNEEIMNSKGDALVLFYDKDESHLERYAIKLAKAIHHNIKVARINSRLNEIEVLLGMRYPHLVYF
jgi:hypothetical protein